VEADRERGEEEREAASVWTRDRGDRRAPAGQARCWGWSTNARGRSLGHDRRAYDNVGRRTNSGAIRTAAKKNFASRGDRTGGADVKQTQAHQLRFGLVGLNRGVTRRPRSLRRRVSGWPGPHLERPFGSRYLVREIGRRVWGVALGVSRVGGV